MTELITTLDKTASSYFQRLSDLMQGIAITNLANSSLSLDDGSAQAVQLLSSTKAKDGKAMIIGNGGSDAIASHAHNDICKALNMQALVFNESSLLTALSNDNGYETVFEHAIDLWATDKDILIAISSSGQSENIHRGVKAAKAKGCQVITLSGFKPDNPLRQMGDLNFYVASSVYGYVELAHQIITHFLTDQVMLQNK
ncbi:MAG: SIS domain-containing protein [Chloroflexota bacterium]